MAVPGGPIWAIYLEKEAGKGSHMKHNHLPHPGPNPGKLYPSFCAGSLPAHISPLNTGYGGTAAPHYRRITPCEHPGGLFAPARPFTHIGGGFHRESSKTGSVGFHTFPGLGPGYGRWLCVICGHCPASFSRYVTQLGPPGTAKRRNRPSKVGYDLSTK